MRILVTGGIRSGKSAYAEGLLADRPAVNYLAAGPKPSTTDPDWAARVRAHRARRPASWTTVEDLDPAVAPPLSGPTLLDCLGSWLTGQLDDLGAWEGDGWQDPYADRVTALVAAVQAAHDLVLVTNEVGLGVIPAHASGRLFADLLGTLNQQVAAVCDEVHLVVAGRVLRL